MKAKSLCRTAGIKSLPCLFSKQNWRKPLYFVTTYKKSEETVLTVEETGETQRASASTLCLVCSEPARRCSAQKTAGEDQTRTSITLRSAPNYRLPDETTGENEESPKGSAAAQGRNIRTFLRSLHYCNVIKEEQKLRKKDYSGQ